MTTGTGLDAQLMLKKETTWGTPVTPDRGIPLNDETVSQTPDLYVSPGLVAGRLLPDVKQAKRGAVHVGGDLMMDLLVQSQACLMYGLLGANSTGGAGPYAHTATPGGALPFWTFQIGRPDVNGTVQPFTYGSCKINTGTISATVGEAGKLKLGVIGGVKETNATALAVAAYGTNTFVPFVFRELGVQVDGQTVKAEALEVNVDNKLKERLTAGRDITDEPRREDRMSVGGKITVELENLDEHAKFKAGTALDVVATFSDGTYSVVITVHTILQGSAPNVKGAGRILHDLAWNDAFGDGTDADGFTIVSTNADSAV